MICKYYKNAYSIETLSKLCSVSTEGVSLFAIKNAAEKLGFKRILIPKHNMQGLDTKKMKIEIIPVRKVEEAFRALFG